jgi:hypothetical protein
LPPELQRLHGLIDAALAATADLWPPVRMVFGWVHRAAQILGTENIDAGTARRQLGGLLGAMARHRGRGGDLSDAVDHFGKVSRSYWSGLFHCYEVDDLPRTNNALEQFFGSHRYHERRATGRKVASPALVLRGSARILAAAATRQKQYSAAELSQVDHNALKQLRETLDERRHRRTQRRRFRQDSQTYLKDLEAQLRQLRLPA